MCCQMAASSNKTLAAVVQVQRTKKKRK